MASRFPIINSLSELQPAVSHKDELRFTSQTNGTVVACYVVSGPDTFDSTLARECRGITFDAQGNVAGRPLHKFFNLNEKPETAIHLLRDKKIVRLMDKRDGSMIHTVWLDGKVELKSKKSFTSDVAKAASEWIHHPENELYLAFCEFIASRGMTAIFEWTSPKARIVLAYPDEQLRLLHVRRNNSGTYLAWPTLLGIAQAYGVELVDDLEPCSLDELVAKSQAAEGIEGWIAQFEDGEMVKVKTAWYTARHYVCTALRVRDVAKAFLEEATDDIKAQAAEMGLSVEAIEAVERRVMADLRKIHEVTLDLYNAIAHMTRKEAAALYSTHPYFRQAMRCYTAGSTDGIDAKEYFKRDFLPNYELDTLAVTDSAADK